MDLATNYFEGIKPNWVYHCMVSPKTSQIEKPEWYVNLTLKYIDEHIELIKFEAKNSDDELLIRKAFILKMLELLRMRLHRDMCKLSSSVDKDKHSEKLLIHTYNEIIRFVQQIRQLLGSAYEEELEDKHDVMAVFSDQLLFEKIFQAEQEYSYKNLKDVTSSEAAWDSVLEGDYADYYKIPRCVDRFILQIRSISERVDCFREPDCKSQLIDLQCSLFDKLLIFMKRTEPTTNKSIISDIFMISDGSEINLSRTAKVINGVNFLRLILKERCFLSKDDLSEDLDRLLRKTTEDYVIYFNKLIAKVTKMYEQSDCDLKEFLDFVKPKMARDIYLLVEDEATKGDQHRHTQTMFKNLSLGRE